MVPPIAQPSRGVWIQSNGANTASVYITSASTSPASTYTHTTAPTVTAPLWQHYVNKTNWLGGPRVRVRAAIGTTIELPDGAVLRIDDRGNYKIEDRDAQVTYEANRCRAWNRYVAGSDLLEEFIEEARRLGGIGKRQFLALPIELFIRWLVLRAAEQDGEPAEPLRLEFTTELRTVLPAPRPRCRHCGRWVRRPAIDAGLPFCTPDHMLAFAGRAGVFA